MIRTIYEPNKRSKIGVFKVWKQLILNLITNKELVYQLFKRDFLMMYKKSFLGMGWLVISPIMGIISWVFMNETGILAPGETGIPYPAYVLLSTTIWSLFVGFYNSASATLQAGNGFILQVNFPHDILFFKQALQQIVNFLITFGITIIVLMLFGIIPSWQIILLPILILPIFFLGSAFGLLVSVISVVASDVNKFSSFLITILMYVTPIIYSSKIKNPLIRQVIEYNPLTYLIGSVRESILYGHIECFNKFLISSLLSFLVFLLSWRLFFISEERVIEKIM